jgi:hypothetical protein
MTKTIKTLAVIALLFGSGLIAYLLYGVDIKASDNATQSASENLSIPESIARLHGLYTIFTDPTSRQTMSLEQKKSAESEFLSILERIPLDIMLTQMEKYDVAYRDQVNRYQQPEAFVQRLAKLAMNGIITPVIEAEPQYGAVQFSASHGELSRDRFASVHLSVIASFDSSDYQEKTVLVKWFETDSGNITLFKQFQINPEPSNYVWIHDKAGFAPGNYRVEIFRVSETLDLLSSGNYRVTAD